MSDVLDWMADSFIGFIVGAILLLALFFGGIILLSYPLVSYSCSHTADAMGLEHQFGLWTDCLVKTQDGHWIPLDKYRAVEFTGRDKP